MIQCAGGDAADSTRAGAATVLFTAASQHPHLVPAVLDAGVLQLLQQLEHSPSPTARAMAVAGREYFLLEQQARSAPQAAEPAAAAGTAPQRQQSGRRRVCAAPDCGAERGLRRCGGCGAVRYCTEACSRAHWQTHKAECRRLQAEKAAAEQRSDSAEPANP